MLVEGLTIKEVSEMKLSSTRKKWRERGRDRGEAWV
jgi:hypothetical protein